MLLMCPGGVTCGHGGAQGGGGAGEQAVQRVPSQQEVGGGISSRGASSGRGSSYTRCTLPNKKPCDRKLVVQILLEA